MKWHETTGAFASALILGGCIFDNAIAREQTSTDAVGPGSSPAAWSLSAGDVSRDLARRFATDADGNVVVLGDFSRNVDFGGGALSSTGGQWSDVFLTKLDAAGNHLWSRSFGDVDWDRALGMALRENGNVVFAITSESGAPVPGASLTEVDAAGNHLWTKQLDGLDWEDHTEVAIDASGNLILAGHFSGGDLHLGPNTIPSLSADVPTLFVAKLDAAGNHLWSRGLCVGVWANAAPDTQGNVVLAANYSASECDGQPVPPPPAADDDPHVGLLLEKLDADGNRLWMNAFMGVQHAIVSEVAVDTNAAGDVLVAGTVDADIDLGGGPLAGAGGQDCAVAMFDASGNHLWSRRFGDGADQYCHIASFDPSGGIFVAGGFDGAIDLGGTTVTSMSGLDPFFARFDETGNPVSIKSIGVQPSSELLLARAATDTSGQISFTASFSGSVDVGSGAHTSAGDYDVLIAKVAP